MTKKNKKEKKPETQQPETAEPTKKRKKKLQGAEDKSKPAERSTANASCSQADLNGCSSGWPARRLPDLEFAVEDHVLRSGTSLAVHPCLQEVPALGGSLSVGCATALT